MISAAERVFSILSKSRQASSLQDYICHTENNFGVTNNSFFTKIICSFEGIFSGFGGIIRGFGGIIATFLRIKE